jgi:hypothetical protein
LASLLVISLRLGKSNYMKTILPSIFLLASAISSLAHPGDLDDYGGHQVHADTAQYSPIGYHFHRDVRPLYKNSQRDLRLASRDAQKRDKYEDAGMLRFLMYENGNALKYLGWAQRHDKRRGAIIRDKINAIKAMNTKHNWLVQEAALKKKAHKEAVVKQQARDHAQKLASMPILDARVYIAKRRDHGSLCKVRWSKSGQSGELTKDDFLPVSETVIYVEGLKGHTGSIEQVKISQIDSIKLESGGRLKAVPSYKVR